MHDQWTTMRPSSTLNEKQLVTQRLNIVKKGFLSRLEIEEVRNKCEGSTSEKEYRPSQQSEEVPPQPTLPKVATTETLRKSAAETRQRIVTRISHLGTASRGRLPRLGGKLPEDMLEDINAALLTIPSHSITETNTLMYATAAVTLETLGYKIKDGENKSPTPPWRRRLEAKVKAARSDISKLTEVKKGAPIRDKARLLKKYPGMDTAGALETAKQRLVALSARLRRYIKEADSKRMNALFSKEPGKVYSQLQNKASATVKADPPKVETEQYWKNIWEKDATHNADAQWLKDLKAQHSDIPEQTPVTVTTEDIQHRANRMRSWAAPGPDMIHAYWLKKLTALHSRLATQMSHLIAEGSHPEWLTTGRTVLIMKDPEKGTVPNNYRPITCLPTTWKLLSGIIAQKVQDHTGSHMDSAQKGIGKDTRGSKHQLLIDRAVARDSKARQTNLSTAWIDYRKAYDSMPHTWILECLQLYKVNPVLRTFIGNSMRHWKTTLEANSKEIARVHIKCGIYQGDALSPLLFCLGLNPLSDIIRKTAYGYQFKSGTTVSHLLYMDDIKLYGKNERDVDSLIQLTRIYSQDIGMSFGLEKCGRLVVKRGKTVKTQGVDLPNGHIEDVQDSYKYLGIAQSYGTHDEEARKAATSKYLKRVRQVLKSQLNGRNKIRAINSYAIPVIRYPAAVVTWPSGEMDAADIKTRKLLTMHGGLHPKSNTQRLYASRKAGGRGLEGVKSTILKETRNMWEYIERTALHDPPMAEYHKQMNGGTLKEITEEEWHTKALHGMYHRQISEVADLGKSYQWLEKAGLKDSTEALIMAAQEQALSTRSVEAGIYKTRQDPRCRLCKEHPETVQHITSGCKILAGNKYTERHNQVAGMVHRNICKEYELETPASRWEVPQRVVENKRAKILWDFPVQTDKHVIANRPDIVIIDKEKKTAMIIDVAVPSDCNIKKKEHEKIDKYQGLREEMEKMWKVEAKVVPIVVGALGAVTTTLEKWLEQIPGRTTEISIQKNAILGTSRILRRTLKLPGLW